MQDFSVWGAFSITLHISMETEILTHHWEIKITVIRFLKELHKNLNHWVIKINGFDKIFHYKNPKNWLFKDWYNTNVALLERSSSRRTETEDLSENQFDTVFN